LDAGPSGALPNREMMTEMDSEYNTYNNTATLTDVQKPFQPSALAEIRGHEILDTHYAKGFHFTTTGNGGVVDQKELNKQFRAKNANQLKNISDLKNSFGYF